MSCDIIILKINKNFDIFFLFLENIFFNTNKQINLGSQKQITRLMLLVRKIFFVIINCICNNGDLYVQYGAQLECDTIDEFI